MVWNFIIISLRKQFEVSQIEIHILGKITGRRKGFRVLTFNQLATWRAIIFLDARIKRFGKRQNKKFPLANKVFIPKEKPIKYRRFPQLLWLLKINTNSKLPVSDLFRNLSRIWFLQIIFIPHTRRVIHVLLISCMRLDRYTCELLSINHCITLSTLSGISL